jgi:hypothetical protein
MLRGHDLAHYAAGHHLAQADIGRVGRGIAHAAAHIGVERQVGHLDQRLAVPRLGHRHFLDAEIALRRFARRAAHQDDAAVVLG